MIDDKKVPYEILIRFGEDGKPKGAHVQYRRIVTLDGEILKDEPLPAEPLGLADFPTSDVMNETTAAALARVTELEAALAVSAEVEKRD